VPRKRPSRAAPRDLRRPPAERPAATRRGPGVAWALAAAAALTALGLAWWLGRGGAPRRPGDPAAGLDPVAAYEAGIRLGREERYTESLPYFRRAAEAPGGSTWQVHHDYSSSLHNAALESRKVGRYGQRVTRSSVERVAIMHESFRQLDLARAVAGSRRDQAFIEAMRGNTLVTWGFPLDALACYGRALALDPTMKAVPRK